MRIIVQARAEKIANSKLKSAVDGWPGTITAAYLAEADTSKDQEGSLVIIDGQHRLGACSYLESKVHTRSEHIASLSVSIHLLSMSISIAFFLQHVYFYCVFLCSLSLSSCNACMCACVHICGVCEYA